jgi:NAD-reducing hydrogenase large subunit
VGPLARVNACDFIDTPEAEAARQEFLALTGGKPNNLSMAYHWARMIELVHAAEKIQLLLNDPDLQGTDLVVTGERREEAVGLIEAPRGTLFHHYQVDKNDQVVRCNLIVATTNNNMPMNHAVEGVARDTLSGTEITEGLLNRIEVAIRAYDPCLSCATQAMGQMPLTVEIVDRNGRLVDRKSRGGPADGE